MFVKLRAFFLSLTVAAILMFSAFGTITVYADDGTPTVPTETGTPTPVAGEGVTPVVTEEPVQDVPEVVAQEPAQDISEVVTEEPSPGLPEVTPEPILEQLPENTTVTVVNAEGEAQPLVSQDSADAILLSDPIWCPAGQAPTPGANGCTKSYSSFTKLLTFLKANEGNVAYQQAGTIYVQQGAYLGGESSIDFNSYGFTNLNQHDLTVHGGWDTVDNSVDATDTSQFNVPIIIGTSSNPWVGSLTFNNIVINNVSNQTGLTLYTMSDIALSNVQVSNSLNGANLNAGVDVTIANSKFDKNKKTGATIKSGGVVEISNSSFNSNSSSANQGKGLDISSAGNVTLVSVYANNNQVFGANVVAGGTVVAVSSFFSGNKSYTYNCNNTVYSGYGLKVITTGVIVLDTVSANDNNLFGANLDGGTTVITGSQFNNNSSGSINSLTGKGLQVKSSDIVVLSDVHANSNQLFGADIHAVGDVTINNSFFSGQKAYVYDCRGKIKSADGGGYGLQVVTNGIVDLKTVEAANNYLYGAHVAGSAVSILGGNFSNNGSGSVDKPTGFGLEVISTGEVTLDTIAANNNQLFGANVQAGSTVTVKNSFFSGQQSYSFSPCRNQTNFYGYGLTVVTTAGSINLDGVVANQNNLWGTSLTGSDITVANSEFNLNVTDDSAFIDDTGLLIESSGGVVALDNVHANENRLIGATIHAAGDVLINNSVFSSNQGTTCQDSKCKNVDYHGYGLNVVAGGYVELNEVTANDNYLFGAHLEGSSVSIFNSTFSNNGSGDKNNPTGRGLEVVSTGDVTLLNVHADTNELFGANIQTNGDVTINNSVFSGNIYYTSGTCKGKTANGYGLQVITTNDITLDNVTANDNGLYGATLDGSLVQVSNSTFENNVTSHGLAITADVVVVENTTAINNGVDGAIICANDVTVDDSVFENNVRYGLNVGAPVFSESGNTYFGNGTRALNYNPTCNPNGNGNNNSGNSSHNDHGNNHGQHNANNTSDHRCSSDKSDNTHDDKNHSNNHGSHDSKTSDSRCSSDTKSQQSDGKKK